jgi:hypothetical protein
VGALKHVNLLLPFMDKLFVFQREVVANKNWIGIALMQAWCIFVHLFCCVVFY